MSDPTPTPASSTPSSMDIAPSSKTTTVTATPAATTTTTAAAIEVAPSTTAAAATTSSISTTTSSSSSSSSSSSPAPAPSISLSGSSIPSSLHSSLNALLFGSSPDPLDVARWHTQGFVFSCHPHLSFGLTQLYGGPCGILAPVQAEIIKELIFQHPIHVDPDGEVPIQPTPEQAKHACRVALCNILQKARPSQGSPIILVTGIASHPVSSTESSSSSTTIPTLTLYSNTFHDIPSVSSHLTSHWSIYESPIGVLLFVYSMLLTRSIERVKSDMDDLTLPLVARFGHCSQELVNLMIVGQAVSNVFDGRKVLDGNVEDVNAYALRGIPHQTDVGFLTLLEALRYSSEVGANYKTPKYPIWVIGSSSHYTVLFGLDRSIGQVSTQEKALQSTRAAFNELDPESNGFIPVEKLHILMNKIGIHADVNEVKKRVDPDNMGIVLWQAVATAVTDWQHEQLNAAQQMSEWACTACTFINPPTARACDICATAAPPPKVIAKPKDEQKQPNSFTLYHYNGIDGHGKSIAACFRVSLTLVDGSIRQDSGSHSQGLREVILTKWPHAIVEYQGGKPKIT